MNIGILVVLIFLCVVSSSLEIASNKSIAILGIMLLTISTLLFSTRNPQVVPDTQAYIYVYDHIKNANFTDWSIYNYYGFEPGYIFLNICFNKLGASHEVFFAATYLLQTLMFIRGMKILNNARKIAADNQENIKLCTFVSVYLGYIGMFYGAIVIRTGLAMGAAFLSYSFFRTGKIRNVITYSIIAVLFHKSVIILLIVIVTSEFIKYDSIGFYQRWLVAIVFLWLSRISLILNKLILVFINFIGKMIPLLNGYMEGGYTNNLMGNGFLSKKNMLYLALGFLFVKLYRKSQEKEYRAALNIYLIGMTVTFFLNEYSDGYRAYDLMLIFSLPLLLWILTDSKMMKIFNRWIYAVGVILLQFIITYRIIMK